MSLYDKFQIFFQLMVKMLKENLNLQLSLIFYSSIMFVLETVFIPKQIAENSFGALLEIGVKFITKLIVFSYMISGLKQSGKLITIPYGFKNTVARQFYLKVHSSHHKSYGSNFFEIGEDIKIKHSFSSQVTLGSNKYKTQ